MRERHPGYTEFFSAELPSHIELGAESQLLLGPGTSAILQQMNNNVGRQQACPVWFESSADYFPNPIRGKGIHYKGSKEPHSPHALLTWVSVKATATRGMKQPWSAELPGFQKQQSSLRGAQPVKLSQIRQALGRHAGGSQRAERGQEPSQAG